MACPIPNCRIFSCLFPDDLLVLTCGGIGKHKFLLQVPMTVFLCALNSSGELMVTGSNKQPPSLVITVPSKAKQCSGPKDLLNR